MTAMAEIDLRADDADADLFDEDMDEDGEFY